MQRRQGAAAVAPLLLRPLLRLVLLLFALLLVLPGAAAADNTTASGGDPQSAALLLFKAGISNADKIPVLATWTTAAASPCSWAGVGCSEGGNVTRLSLGGLGLEGSIAPNSLSAIASLEQIDLSANALTSAVPDDWNAWGALPQLQSLNLRANRLSSAPTAWGEGGCAALRDLLLDGNTFAELPIEWTFLSLQTLGLAQNEITGSIPASWNFSATARVVVLPQASGVEMCGPVPPLPTYLFASNDTTFPLSNNLGSCLASKGGCTNFATAANLAGTNIYDAAREAGVVAWDAAGLNPTIDPSVASTSSIVLPCYSYGSPPANYLGSDVAFLRPAWGSGSGQNASAVTAVVPPAQATRCFTTSGSGSYWQADLGSTQNLTMVLLSYGTTGRLVNVTLTLGDDPDPVDPPCATLDLAGGNATTSQTRPGQAVNVTGLALNTTATLECRASGRYLKIAGDELTLCLVQAFTPAASASVNKAVLATRVTRGAGSSFETTLNQTAYTGLAALNASSLSKAALALDFNYTAPIAGVYLTGDLGVNSVFVSNSSINATTGAPPVNGSRCLRGPGTVGQQVLTLAEEQSFPVVVTNFSGPNARALHCGGAVGRYLILASDGETLTIGGVQVYLSEQPGGIQPFPPVPQPSPSFAPTPSPPPSPPPSPSGGGSGGGGISGAVIGGIVGGCIGAIILIWLGWWWYRKQRIKQQEKAAQGDQSDEEDKEKGGKSGEVSPSASGGAAARSDSKGRKRPPKSGGSAPFGGDPLLALIANKLSSKRLLGAGTHSGPLPPLAEGGSGQLPTLAEGREGSAGNNSEAPGPPEGLPPRPPPALLGLPAVSNSSLRQASLASSLPSSLRQGSLSTDGSSLPNSFQSWQLWIVNFDELQISRQVGEGSFGRVFLARWHETQVAVKLLLGTPPPGAGGGTEELEQAADRALAEDNPIQINLQQEAGMMAALRHPNVVGFLGVCIVPPCVLSEYCSRGSLFDILQAARRSRQRAAQLLWPRRLAMALDAAKGMLYLHSHQPPIIHRDLKSPNLLVDGTWKCKVSDFNLSRIMEEATAMSSTVASNPRWLAPEILRGEPATQASDVYSFGVVLWELAVWEMPWGSRNPWQIANSVAAGARLEFPPAAELPGDGGALEGLDAYVQLAQRCWAAEPAERPAFGEVITQLRDMLGAAVKRKMRGRLDEADGD